MVIPELSYPCFHTAVGEVIAAALDRVRNTSHLNEVTVKSEAAQHALHSHHDGLYCSMLAPRSIPVIVSLLLHVLQ
jgi:hypothetical protein